MTVIGLALAKACSQPGHGRDRHQAELVKHDDDAEQPGKPGRLGIADGQADQQVEPGDAYAGRDGERHAARAAPAGVEPETDSGPTAIISPATNRLRSASAATRPARTALPGCGQRSEPVDHAGRQVFSDSHPGLGRAPNPIASTMIVGQQVVDVPGHPGTWMAPAEV